MLRADTPVRYLKGVGPRRAAALEALGIVTLEDLLYDLPFRYEDRRAFARIAELQAGGPETTLDVEIVSARTIRTRRRGFTIFEAVLGDASGEIRALWYNQPYLERILKAGRRAVLFGRPTADRYGRRVVLENPDYEILDAEDAEGIHTGRVVPVYRKLADLSSRMQRSLLHRALAAIEPGTLRDLVPVGILDRLGMPRRALALTEVHFPRADADPDDLQARCTPAQRSLAFEEIFLLQLALAMRRRGRLLESRRTSYRVSDALRTRLARVLPFRLTLAQRRALKEIGEDLRSPHPMTRLLQGDVGSGKTIVALLTLLVAVENGHQGALMAPTEILAEQHFRNLSRILADAGDPCRLVRLTGSVRGSERRAILGAIAAGQADVAVGTHALFEEGVSFRSLGLVVVDEQHRFGVLQRAALARKGERPDVLVMTATPIPRSLALTVYGDLDLSTLDELPPGRTPIRTVVRSEVDREKVFAGLRREILAGRQAYVVVPLVEESGRSDLKAATAYAGRLKREVFPDVAVGLLHGRMKGAEKDSVMRDFARGAIRILVATTVIEVGVDVANATVMIVEHAERFGLSQLHQLRGRVGRGSERSYCILMVGADGMATEAMERLRMMERCSDGFRIAEKDLELRGPGAVFGTQQHGLSDLQFLSVVLRDPPLLAAARKEAFRLVESGSSGAASARAILKAAPASWQRRLDLPSVG